MRGISGVTADFRTAFLAHTLSERQNKKKKKRVDFFLVSGEFTGRPETHVNVRKHW